jgi:hypothetical protein
MFATEHFYITLLIMYIVGCTRITFEVLSNIN